MPIHLPAACDGMPVASLSVAALLLALAVDRWLGEPPMRWHLVVWIGNYLTWAGARVQRGVKPRAAQDYRSFWLAALYWGAGAAAAYGAGWGLAGMLTRLPYGLAALVLGFALKPLLAWTMLSREVRGVEAALGESLARGRERLSWLVSRDTASLNEAQVRESAIESLAENLNDSVVAPIFWFVLLGLPGAALYRFANTADAMWGYPGIYKGANWQWAGKWAARADDVLNYIPARLTGLLMALSCGVPLSALRREAAKTPSPNSGWPMAAMALGLGLRLAKPGVYALNPAGRAPEAPDLYHANTCCSKTLLVLMPLALTAIYGAETLKALTC